MKMNWSNAKTIILKDKEVENELKKNEAEYKIIEDNHEINILHSLEKINKNYDTALK
jgi:hypothetical protein